MERDRTTQISLWLAIADAIGLSVSWWATVELRSRIVIDPLPPLPPEILMPLGALLVPIWLTALWSGNRHGRTPSVLRPVAAALSISLALLWVAHIEVNRTVLLGFAALSVPVLFTLRASLHRLFPARARRVWVVGDSAASETLCSHLRRHGVEIAGRIDSEDVPALAAHLSASAADEVVVVGLLPFDTLAQIAAVCESCGIPLSLDASFVGLRAASAELGDAFGWSTITVRQADERDPSRLLKRGIDICGALTALMLFGPLLLLLAMLIYGSDGHPALLKQTRIGRYGRPFVLYKLRTMIPSASPPPEEGWHPGPGYKRANDPRITSIGRWLRRLSLDELPQLVNVLSGEMSLVGPRPPLPDEARRYERWQWRRLSVRPGMTGLWQVSGRADLPFDRWVALDLQYVDRWSLWLDAVLLLRTIPAVISGTGAR